MLKRIKPEDSSEKQNLQEEKTSNEQNQDSNDFDVDDLFEDIQSSFANITSTIENVVSVITSGDKEISFAINGLMVDQKNQTSAIIENTNKGFDRIEKSFSNIVKLNDNGNTKIKDLESDDNFNVSIFDSLADTLDAMADRIISIDNKVDDISIVSKESKPKEERDEEFYDEIRKIIDEKLKLSKDSLLEDQPDVFDRDKSIPDQLEKLVENFKDFFRKRKTDDEDESVESRGGFGSFITNALGFMAGGEGLAKLGVLFRAVGGVGGAVGAGLGGLVLDHIMKSENWSKFREVINLPDNWGDFFKGVFKNTYGNAFKRIEDIYNIATTIQSKLTGKTSESIAGRDDLSEDERKRAQQAINVESMTGGLVQAEDYYKDPLEAVGEAIGEAKERETTSLGTEGRRMVSSGALISGGALALMGGVSTPLGVGMIGAGLGRLGTDYIEGYSRNQNILEGIGNATYGLNLYSFDPYKVFQNVQERIGVEKDTSESTLSDLEINSILAKTEQIIRSKDDYSVKDYNFWEFNNWAKEYIKQHDITTPEQLLEAAEENAKIITPHTQNASQTIEPNQKPKSEPLGRNQQNIDQQTEASKDAVTIINGGTDRNTETVIYGEPPRERFKNNSLDQYAIFLSMNAPITRGLATV